MREIINFFRRSKDAPQIEQTNSPDIVEEPLLFVRKPPVVVQSGAMVALPDVYRDFHRLEARRKEVTRTAKEYGISNPPEAYKNLRVMLAQVLDSTRQGDLEAQLREEIPEMTADDAEESVREARDVRKTMYWHHLYKGSSLHLLGAVLKSDKASQKREYGKQGGIKVDISDFERTTVPLLQSLQDYDPRLLNQDLVLNTLGRHYQQNVARLSQQSFESHGFPVHSVEFRMSMLVFFELDVKKRMIDPVIRAINHAVYDDIPSFISLPPDERDERKRAIIQNLLVGDSTTPETADFARERFMGTEYYYGLYHMVNNNLLKLAFSMYGDNAAEAIDVIRSVVYMRLRGRTEENAREMQGRVLVPLRDKNIEGAYEALIQLMLENPDLYSHQEQAMDKIDTKLSNIREKQRAG